MAENDIVCDCDMKSMLFFCELLCYLDFRVTSFVIMAALLLYFLNCAVHTTMRYVFILLFFIKISIVF